MLYTGKGDDGTTKTFSCDQRISKSSIIAEALGALDELNSFLGICKSKSKDYQKVIHQVQEDLFIIQAELAGSDMTIEMNKVRKMESEINKMEKELPEITKFFIPGGSELGAIFDFGRTITRRAERRVIAVAEEGKIEIGDGTKAYLNRLSSLLYVLARLSNHFSGIKEESPDYIIR
ncbi:MAG: cob(I)yrinic acid a,c-diamide adenosyltransferase [Patescibacteria group bacterium]|nr:cob(I)yrinic acid a,c-diamide adenosyltransferase [Patescibacteria group bacterium]